MLTLIWLSNELALLPGLPNLYKQWVSAATKTPDCIGNGWAPLPSPPRLYWQGVSAAAKPTTTILARSERFNQAHHVCISKEWALLPSTPRLYWQVVSASAKPTTTVLARSERCFQAHYGVLARNERCCHTWKRFVALVFEHLHPTVILSVPL